MAIEINRIIYVGDLTADHMQETLSELGSAETYEVTCLDEIGKALELHSQGKCNLIILNDNLIEKDIFTVTRELKRRSPLTPVMILSKDLNTNYQTNLMMAGADDFVPVHAAKEELYYRIGFRLKQHRQSRDLAARNRNMYELTTLARRLHSNVDPQTLIVETIDQTCGSFKLYGLAIALMEEDMLNVYAGQNGVVKAGNLYETKMYPNENEPFHRVVQSGVAQVYDNINEDPNFVPIPILPDVESAIIVPLRYQDYNMGALVAFGRKDVPLALDDLALYEILTAQFSVALQNAHYSHNQLMNIQFSRTLRRAWQRFVTLQSPNDIAQDLYEMIKDLPGVQQGIIWLHDRDYWWMERPVIFTDNPKLAEIVEELIRNEHIFQLIEQMDDGPQVLSQLGLGQKDPFFPLFRALRSHQLVVLPLADSTRLIGGIIVSVTSNRQFSIDVVNLMKSLTHAAGQALERMTLIFATLEKSGRLEAILLSISEGIFFVDDNGKVAFCNPQFTELTNVNPSEVLGHDPDVLLERISSQAIDSTGTRKQLRDALANVQNPTSPDFDYPIVEVEFAHSDLEIHVEFVTIENLNSREKSWIGIVRNTSRLRSRPSTQPSVYLDSPVVDKGIDPVVLVQQILERRLPSKFKGRVQVKTDAQLPLVEVDEALLEENVVKTLQNTFKVATGDENYSVTLEVVNKEVRLSIQPDQPAARSVINDNTRIGTIPPTRTPSSVGDLVIPAQPFNGQQFVSMPIVKETPVPSRGNWNISDVGYNDMRMADSGGAPHRAPQTVMLIEGGSAIVTSLRNQLEGHGYDILRYHSGEDAVRDVKLTRIDLIVVDTRLTDMTGLDVCEYMRKYTEAPIIMVGDTASDTEKVRALNLGADDYITRPISDEELLARVQVIFKRQQIPDRTRKPLDMGDLVIDFARREVFVNTKRIELTRIEYDLLHSLVVNQGQVLTHQQILEKVWGPEYRSETQYLWVNICRLRKKLEPTKYIQNRQGVGYVFQQS